LCEQRAAKETAKAIIYSRTGKMNNYRALVTGGAGFIGSHLIESLLKVGNEVTILDNFTTGKIENIEPILKSPSLSFLIKDDLKESLRLPQIVENCEVIFHLSANPEVRIGETDPEIHFKENILATFNLLEAIKKTKTPKVIVFTSTSSVYGEASVLPTPENYGPLNPISTYGASKLCCEALISSYAHTFDMRALTLRLANVVGARSDHGVIHDFIQKLQKNPSRLEILGDGNQKKSYLYIDDCIDAILHATKVFLEGNKAVDIYNVGSTDQVTVERIAEITVEEMKLRNVKFDYTGGVNGGRGWKGDVKNMCLSVRKLIETGWKPKYSSEEAVRLTVKSSLNQDAA
jgi:UDP-glucose 4-epimerase